MRIGHAVKVMAAAASLACGAGALAYPGADVILRDIQTVSNYGQVSGVYGYAIGSHTCNIGNVNLHWTNNFSPGLAMNAYRLSNGRLVQIGLGNAKTACCAGAQTTPMCAPTCNGSGGSVLGAGCLDVYSSGWNGGQGRLAPRSSINAHTGAFTAYAGTSGNAVYRRLQVPGSEMGAAFPGALYFVEGVYVGDDDAPAGNNRNNATYRRVTMDSGFNMTLTGTAAYTIPAIQAWRENGLGVGQVDARVEDVAFDVPGEGRFHAATKVTDLGNGRWLYDYAVFNLCSDRSGGSLSVPVPAGVTVTGMGFHAPLYHSGEVYSNAPWTMSRTADAVVFASPETFAQNANTNALRWGTMYNFWFEADQPPSRGNVTLGLFKPGTPSSVEYGVSVPGGPSCSGDVNCDGNLDGFDVRAMEMAVGGDVSDFCLSDADFNHDGNVDGFDVQAVEAVVGGAACP